MEGSTEEHHEHSHPAPRPPTPHPNKAKRHGSRSNSKDDLLDEDDIEAEIIDVDSPSGSSKLTQSGKGLFVAKIQVLFATYDGSVVTVQVQEITKNKPSLTVVGGARTIFKDTNPAPFGAPKMFSMSYTYVTSQQHKICGISDGIKIDAPKGFKIRIPSAAYGGKDCTAEVKALVAATDGSSLDIPPGAIHTALGLPVDTKGGSHVFEVSYVFHTEEFDLTCTDSEDIIINAFQHIEGTGGAGGAAIATVTHASMTHRSAREVIASSAVSGSKTSETKPTAAAAAVSTANTTAVSSSGTIGGFGGGAGATVAPNVSSGEIVNQQQATATTEAAAAAAVANEATEQDTV
jgi:hypothetical protein